MAKIDRSLYQIKKRFYRFRKAYIADVQSGLTSFAGVVHYHTSLTDAVRSGLSRKAKTLEERCLTALTNKQGCVTISRVVKNNICLTSYEVDPHKWQPARVMQVRIPRFFIATVGLAPDQLTCEL